MRRLVPALLAGVVLAVAGCGGDGGTDKAAYVKQINEVGQTLQQQLSSLGSDISSQSDPRGIARKLDDGAAKLDDAAKELDGIDPPADARKAHQEIVDGVHELARTFKAAVAQARDGKLAALVKTFSGISSSPGIQKISAATRELKAAGYKIE